MPTGVEAEQQADRQQRLHHQVRQRLAQLAKHRQQRVEQPKRFHNHDRRLADRAGQTSDSRRWAVPSRPWRGRMRGKVSARVKSCSNHLVLITADRLKDVAQRRQAPRDAATDRHGLALPSGPVRGRRTTARDQWISPSGRLRDSVELLDSGAPSGRKPGGGDGTEPGGGAPPMVPGIAHSRRITFECRLHRSRPTSRTLRRSARS